MSDDPYRGGFACERCAARFFIPQFLEDHVRAEHSEEDE